MSDEKTKALIDVQSAGGDMIAADAELLQDVASGGGFLPYVQLFTTKSDPVTDGKIAGGHYGIVRDQKIDDLGEEIDVIVLTVRPRAFEKAEDGEITVCYDKDDPEYARIAALQANKVIGRMVGPEFLIWLPAEACFATFFCGSPTLKREARKFGPFLGGRAMNLRTKICKNAKGKWHGPVVNACSATLEPLPTAEEAADQVEKFKNPPKQDKGERVDENDAESVVR